MILWSKNQLTGQGLQSAVRFRVDVTFVLSLHMHPSTSQSRSSVASCLDLLFGEVHRPQSRVGGSSLTHASVHVSTQPFSHLWKRGLSWPPANFSKKRNPGASIVACDTDVPSEWHTSLCSVHSCFPLHPLHALNFGHMVTH